MSNNSNRKHQARKSLSRWTRPILEALEDRLVLSTLQAQIIGLPPSGHSPDGTTVRLIASVSGGVGGDLYSWSVTHNDRLYAVSNTSTPQDRTSRGDYQENWDRRSLE